MKGSWGAWRVSLRTAEDGPSGGAGLLDEVDQPANAGDLDRDHVARAQRELVRRHDARSGQQDSAVRKAVVPAKPADEFLKRPLHLRQLGGTLEHFGVLALDGQIDAYAVQRRQVGLEDDGRAEGTGAVVDLGLRQI